MTITKGVFLKQAVFEGVPQEEHFTIINSDVDIDNLQDGDVAVNVKYMSVDPYLRLMIKQVDKDTPLPKPMVGFVSGVVVNSKNSAWVKGDLFGANLPFITFQVLKSSDQKSMIKLTGFIDEKNLSWGIGVLGMPGSTAYAGVVGVLRPEIGKNETIFISAATGAVGSLASQIAKNHFGCKTIGTCGGPAKVQLCKDRYSYDVAIDYKEVTTKEALQKILQEEGGVDMYFENVGSYQFDAAFASLKGRGRVAVCGQIANYNDTEFAGNNVNLMSMIYTQTSIQGFVCHEWLYGNKGNFLQDMSDWLKKGVVKTVDETMYQGVEKWPIAFQSLFTSASAQNKGKVIVKV